MRIGIAGAGIGGLAAAALLAKGGHSVMVYDRFEAPRPVGSGLVMQPVGMAVLDEIGAGGAARALGEPLDAMFGDTAAGRVVLSVRYGSDADRKGLGIHRAALFHVLLRAALDAGALRLNAGARRWHVAAYQAMSGAFTPQYQSDSALVPVLRDRVLAPLSRVWPVPDILTRLVCGDLVPPMPPLSPRAVQGARPALPPG